MTSRRLSRQEFSRLVALHGKWLATAVNLSAAAEGEQLSLVDAIVEDVKLSGADLANSELVRCHFERATFESCDFSYAVLIGSDFHGCRFLECRFVKADLTSANLGRADLSRSDLTRADLTRASLKEANLTGCLLNWAWLIGTDLRGAIVDDTEFGGARLQAPHVYGMDRRKMGSVERAIVDSVDLSPGADGSLLRSGADALRAFAGEG